MFTLNGRCVLHILRLYPRLFVLHVCKSFHSLHSVSRHPPVILKTLGWLKMVHPGRPPLLQTTNSDQEETVVKKVHITVDRKLYKKEGGNGRNQRRLFRSLLYKNTFKESDEQWSYFNSRVYWLTYNLLESGTLTGSDLDYLDRPPFYIFDYYYL